MGGRSVKSLGGSPVTLYMTTESVDKLIAKAVRLGATVKVPVGDMLWGDRSGTIVDPEGKKVSSTPFRFRPRVSSKVP
jgi:PhnB protein